MKKGNLKKRRLREPLNIGEKALVLAQIVKKKDAPKNLYKPTTENIVFFNKDKKFVIKKKLNVCGSPPNYYYWISDENNDNEIIEKRFTRQELFVICNQFIL